MHRLLILLGSALLFSSCASSLKKKCESTNWFSHGEQIAKTGQRVNSDPYLQQCEREEALVDHAALSNGFKKGLDEYCTPDFAYRVGKEGEFLGHEMCPVSVENTMKQKHTEGVTEYCQVGNGVTAGSTGKKYNLICPKSLESAFLPEFNKGRKKYLLAQVTEKELEARDLDREIADLEYRKRDIQYEIDRLERRRLSADEKEKYKYGTFSEENELRQVQSQLREKRERQKSVSQEIRETRSELVKLD